MPPRPAFQAGSSGRGGAPVGLASLFLAAFITDPRAGGV
jgi:hypothetical protein